MSTYRSMHPAVVVWWKNREHSSSVSLGCGTSSVCGTSSDLGPFEAHRALESQSSGSGGGIGVRRPLRFLAYKLQLRDDQVAKLAAILDELKIERAQAAVDDRRSVSAFADACEGEAFDAARATEAASRRVKSAGATNDAVVKALAAIHAMLDPEQRARLAYLLRTGAVTL